MQEADGRGATGWAGKISHASRLRLQSFALKLLLVILFSVAFAAQRHDPLLGAFAYFCFWCALFSALAALAQRHKLSATSLSAWDEMAAFLGIALIARFTASLVA